MRASAALVFLAMAGLAAAVDLRSLVKIPDQCVGLEKMHGKSTLNNWFLESATIMPTTTPEELCTRALDCKQLLRPLMTKDNQFKKVCPNDCSGNGICENGECSCAPGYHGLDCSKMRCPSNCNGNGRCALGKCYCAPGFEGESCEKKVQCPVYGGAVCANHGFCMYGQCFCHPGFEGDDCSRVSRCPNDCRSNGLCIYGMCFCNVGYGGADCSTLVVDEPCPSDCSGRGECKYGRCHCDPGYFGKDCSKAVECPRGPDGRVCSGYGSCHRGRCECELGRAGSTCSLIEKCPGNGTCSGNGICLSGSCFCHEGWSGLACDKQTQCKSGCSGNGVCVEGHCKCLPGYQGEDCAEGKALIPRSECSNETDSGLSLTQTTVQRLLKGAQPCPNACSGTGVCLNGTCACLPSHGGADCSQQFEVLHCPNKCSFRGVCVFGKCSCLKGYLGADCSQTAPGVPNTPGKCPSDCSGHGRCDDNHCVCDPGYAGADCSVELPCKDNCHGRGMCHRGQCFCYPGFEGAACEKVARCPSGCSGHGQCFYGKCFCQAYYEGEDCSRSPACAKGCEHGVCMGNDVCVCEPGYSGVACTERLQCSNDCSGDDHGACMATERGVRCVCREGWVGEDCSRPVDKCPNQCSNNGICVNGECKCNAGYTGIDCASKVGGGSLSDVIGRNLAEPTAAPAPGAANPPRFRSVQERTAANLAAVVSDVVHVETASPAAAAQDPAAANLAAALHSSTPSDEMRFVSARAGEDTCPNGCTGHGLCNLGVCFCDPGFTGSDCSTAITCLNDCSGHGICRYGRCYCDPNYSRDDCSEQVVHGRSFPQAWVTAIIAALTFFVGIVVGRKTMVATFHKNLGPIINSEHASLVKH